MSLETKLNAAKKLVRDHLASVDGDAEGVTEQMMNALKDMGATSGEALEEVTEHDLAAVGVPPLVARRVVKLFGGSADGETPKQIVVIDDDPSKLALRLKPADLVAEYDPNDPDNPFGERLKVISEGKRFLVFTESGTLDVKTSAKLLQELRDNYPQRASTLVNGVTCQTYCVGDRPARYGDEHPLYPSTLLYPDGFSQKNVEWGSIDFKIRQLLYIAVKHTGEIKMDREREREIFDLVQGRDFAQVCENFVDAAMKFKEMEGGQQLPSLKIPLGVRQKE